VRQETNTINPTDILAIVHRICHERDWQLLNFRALGVDGEAFAGRVAQRLQEWQRTEGYAEITARLIERAIVYEYCVLLHRAVGMEGTAAQERALIEVWNYITPIIRLKLGDGDRTLDCANNALCIVWQKHKTVRSPGSFLAWAAMVATREALAEIRAAKREWPVSALVDDDEEQNDIEPGPVTSTLCTERGAAVPPAEPDDLAWWETLIRYCLARMKAGADVIIGLVLRDQTVAEVAARLGFTAGRVYVIKFRALERLRQCQPLLQALGRALGAEGGASR
jgi:RNA polymerase sigma factor (sigma-70 family)